MITKVRDTFSFQWVLRQFSKGEHYTCPRHLRVKKKKKISQLILRDIFRRYIIITLMIENTEYFCIWNLNMVLIYIVGIYKTDYSVSIKIIISQVFLQKGILLFIENSDKSVLKDLLQSLYYPWFSRTSFVCFKFKSYFTQGLQKMSNSHIDCKEEKL